MIKITVDELIKLPIPELNELKDLNSKQALKFLNKEINRVKRKLKITCFKQKLCKHNKYMFDINKLLCELDSLQRKYDNIC